MIRDPLLAAKKSLMVIPGVGKSIALDLLELGITSPEMLIGKNPEELYKESNRLKGVTQDRCLLYVFRCAVYFAEEKKPDPEKLKWWNWREAPPQPSPRGGS